jgi:hypothetical protein
MTNNNVTFTDDRNDEVEHEKEAQEVEKHTIDH